MFLSEDDLQQLGFKMGHRKWILNYIDSKRAAVHSNASPVSVRGDAAVVASSSVEFPVTPRSTNSGHCMTSNEFKVYSVFSAFTLLCMSATAHIFVLFLEQDALG